jgi:hypothetical protein
MVSLIDTKISTSWDQPATVNNPTSTGVYLKVDGANHGSHEPIGSPLKNGDQIYFGVGVVDGVGIAGDYESWDLNYVMYPGESISSNGIKITHIKGGDNDTIRIEKTS